ncbi:uncharacterized protein FA14DRAFT_160921 [Meira miltonrushii]|uniref:Uncharacterized protein n=1 Tax=Meira miltonrushii TaxID=1280837 RepID=A0A316VEP7_9BASI|nr:uncharacterized protein FA14DRAFT_160921 [Meira miltonrushii]PWN36000.1 hypothetical protein FA14DRAFT_160921 [Meira miltonrushii]
MKFSFAVVVVAVMASLAVAAPVKESVEDKRAFCGQGNCAYKRAFCGQGNCAF